MSHATPEFTRARWTQIAAAFDTAAAAPPAERRELLRSLCGGDADLCAEVESLLRALEREDDFLDSGAAPFAPEDGAAGRGAVTEEPEVAAGTLVGPFRILREIGRGGMGAVFLAERDDPELRQRVAIKLMRGSDGSGYALRRFVEERRILASLDHPDIARLVDGGVMSDGTPWFAMEYVDGVPLDEYCTRRHANLEERIALFCRVCDTVQYAHRKLVVHRDLKPSNILVTAEGQPKLLDFGVAKLLGPSEDHTGTPEQGGSWKATAPGMRLVTPAYASPEQLRGEPPSMASDVYALGVVLHLLLTGQYPHRGSAGSDPHIAMRLLGGEPVLPSQRVRQRGDARARRLARRLSGDLDAVVLKAMHRSPDARYASPDQLATDLRRHLRGFPVTACRDTRWYRAHRFFGRNRAMVTIAAGGVLLLSSFGLVTARQDRQLAAEQERASAVERFLAGLLLRADPHQANGREMTVRELLDGGAEQLAAGTPADPALRARLFFALGKAYHGLGEYDRAVALMEASHRVQRQLHGAGSPEAISVANQLADVLRTAGHYEAAADLYEVILTARLDAYGDRSTEVARSLNGLAMVRRMQGRYEEAESLLRRALAIDRAHRHAEPAALTQSLNNLGHVMRERGDLASAEALHRESLAARRAMWGDSHFEVSVSLSNLADVLRDRGELGAADSVYRSALALRERLVGEAHPDLAMDRERYARLLHLAGHRDSAERLFRRALAVQRRALREGHPFTATTMYGLGVLLSESARHAESRSLLAEALTARERVLPPDDPRVKEVVSALREVGGR